MQGMSQWQRESDRGPPRSDATPFAPKRGQRRYGVCKRTNLQNLGYFLA